jgi:hypothetical protein
MPPVQWPLQNDRPMIQIVLPAMSSGQGMVRHLLADSGAESQQTIFQLLLAEMNCLLTGGVTMGQVQLGGAYAGWFRLYLVRVRVPPLNFDEPVPIVGVAQLPPGFDGIAAFKYLNRFHYGNFGNPASFGLDIFPVP